MSNVVESLLLSDELSELSNQVRCWILGEDVAASASAGREAEAEMKRSWSAAWADLFMADRRVLDADELGSALRRCSSKIQGGVVLIELLGFTPYVPLGPIGEAERKKLSACKLDERVQERILHEVARALGFPKEFVQQLRDALRRTRRDLQGGRARAAALVAGGIALGAGALALSATGVGALIGAGMGLKGAAAVAAGLAFLGGGSVAAGGFGMAGGMAVLVLGGGTVGAAAGLGADQVVQALTKEATVNEAAKLRVLMDEVLVHHHRDVRLHQEVLRQQRQAIVTLQAEVDAKEVELAKLRAARERYTERIAFVEKRLDQLAEIIAVMERSTQLGRKGLIAASLQDGGTT